MQDVSKKDVLVLRIKTLGAYRFYQRVQERGLWDATIVTLRWSEPACYFRVWRNWYKIPKSCKEGADGYESDFSAMFIMNRRQLSLYQDNLMLRRDMHHYPTEWRADKLREVPFWKFFFTK